jgi:1-acyl-sn-glycerol-3-phosphate acyltransferase
VRNVPWIVAGDAPFYRFVRIVSVGAIGAPCGVQGEGTDNVPRTGPALLAVNHKSDLDPFFVGIAFRRSLRYFAKAELFGNPLVAKAVTSLGAIPVRRGASDRQALESALAVLAAGDALMIFPEGHRFPDDEIHEFQRGVGMLAVRSGAPVYPVALKGSAGIAQGGLRRRTVKVKAGPRVDLGGLEGKKSVAYTEASRRLKAAVEELYATL